MSKIPVLSINPTNLSEPSKFMGQTLKTVGEFLEGSSIAVNISAETGIKEAIRGLTEVVNAMQSAYYQLNEDELFSEDDDDDDDDDDNDDEEDEDEDEPDDSGDGDAWVAETINLVELEPVCAQGQRKLSLYELN